MTLNLAQRSFKVIHFGGNRKPVYDFIYRLLIVIFALYYLHSSTVSEISPVIYAPSQLCKQATKCTSTWVRRHNRYNFIQPLYMASESLLSCISPFLRHLSLKESVILNLAQRSFKVSILVPNESALADVLVVNSSLDLAPFQRYSGSNIQNRQFSLPHFYSG